MHFPPNILANPPYLVYDCLSVTKEIGTGMSPAIKHLTETARELRYAMIAVAELTKRGSIGTAAWEEAFAWQTEAHKRWHSACQAAGQVSSMALEPAPQAYADQCVPLAQRVAKRAGAR